MLFATHDWETTGLTRHRDAELDLQPRAIEFAGIITDGNEILFELEFIVNPGVEIEPIITKITGLTNEDLADKPNISEYLGRLGDFFSRADVAVSHNLSFDKSILHYDLLRRGLSLADVHWPAIECCTVEQTMPQFGRRMKLVELYERLIGPYEQKHRALDDVKLLHAVCQVLGIYDAYKGGSK